ncbi:MAG: HAD family hydrolase [Mycobacteriales bacterium]
MSCTELVQRPLSCAEAVLFDLDGLLVDTEPIWTIAEEELAAALGGSWSVDLKATIAGTRLEAAVPTILSFYGAPVSASAVGWASRFLLDRMIELFDERVPVVSGALELIDGVRALGVPTALVSSSYRVLVDAALARLGARRFDATVAGDEVVRGKPDPQPYLSACARLGVSPARCVVVEDAIAGVASGEAAGCVVVAVPSVAGIPPAPRRHVVATLASIEPDWLVALA